MACWDLLARTEGRPLAALLGGSRAEIASGVSLGIEREVGTLLDQVDRYVEEGYRRIKLKIAPGWDVSVVKAVRDRHPDVPLQVDANSAYTLEDVETFKRLGGRTPLQGNIDPALLFAGDKALQVATLECLRAGASAPGHVVNLGHGVPPDTDPDVLTRLVAFIHDQP